MGRSRLAAAVAGAAAAALTLTAAPASAEEHTRTDAKRDVVLADLSLSVHGKRKAERRVDIVQDTADHRGTRMLLSVEVRELADDGYSFVWGVRAPGRKWYLTLDRGTGATALRLQDVTNETEVACPDLSARISDRTDRARVSVPRSCLDRPEWVRLGVVAIRPQPNQAGYFRADDGGRTGEIAADPRFGPRLERG